MTRLRFSSKIISALLCCVLFSTNCLLANAYETNLWNQRRKAIANKQLALALPRLNSRPPIFSSNQIANIKFPSVSNLDNSKLNLSSNLAPVISNLRPYGTIRKVLMPTRNNNHQLVFHIQDVHLNPEAQKNIGLAIQKLIESKKLTLLALEGAFAPIDLKVFNEFPHREIIQAAADSLLGENKISGAIQAALIATTPPPIIGIDDAAHYHANVQAYKDAAPLQAAVKQSLAEREEQLEREKYSNFNIPLQTFDSVVQSYRKKKISMGEFVKSLKPQKKGQIESFIEALKLETSLNFTQVEIERTRLLTELASKLSEAQMEELIEASNAFGLGSMNHFEFYRRLSGICDAHHLKLSRFPAMDGYIHYVFLSQSIDSEKLLREMSDQEKATYAALIKTDAERKQVAEATQLYLTDKLVNFSLTSEEWREYIRGKVSSPSPRDPINLGGQTVEAEGPGSYAPFEAFYHEAERRDAAMAKNLLQALPNTGSMADASSVLVTGGFHSNGIDKRLTDAGYTVVNFTPKITKINTENGSAYLNIFTQEKTPLEKLFAGQKLFLSPEIREPLLVKIVGLRVVTFATLAGLKSIAIKKFGPVITGGTAGFVWAGHWMKNVFIVISTNYQIGLTIMKVDRNQEIRSLYEKWGPNRLLRNLGVAAAKKIRRVHRDFLRSASPMRWKWVLPRFPVSQKAVARLYLKNRANYKMPWKPEMVNNAYWSSRSLIDWIEFSTQISYELVDTVVDTNNPFGFTFLLKYLFKTVRLGIVYFPLKNSSAAKMKVLADQLEVILNKTPTLDARRSIASRFFFLRRGGNRWAHQLEGKFNDGLQSMPSTGNFIGSQEMFVHLLGAYLRIVLLWQGRLTRKKTKNILLFLIRLLNENPYPGKNPMVVKAAFRAFGAVAKYIDKDPALKIDLVTRYQRILQNPETDEIVRESAARGLREICDPHSIPVITEILEKCRRGESASFIYSPWTQAYLIETLEFLLAPTPFDIRNNVIGPELRDVLFYFAENKEQSSISLRINALKALAQLKGLDEAQIQRMQKIFLEDADPTVQETALYAWATLVSQLSSQVARDNFIEEIVAFIRSNEAGTQHGRSNPYLVHFAKQLAVRFITWKTPANLRRSALEYTNIQFPSGPPNPCIFLDVDSLSNHSDPQQKSLATERVSALLHDLHQAGLTVFATDAFRDGRDTASLTQEGEGHKIQPQLHYLELERTLKQLEKSQPSRIKSRDPNRDKPAKRMDRILAPVPGKPIVIIGHREEHDLIATHLMRSLPFVAAEAGTSAENLIEKINQAAEAENSDFPIETFSQEEIGLHPFLKKLFSPNVVAALRGFFEDTIVRYAILTWLFPPVLSYLGLSLSPMETVVVYAGLFATLMHPKIFFGKSPKSLWFWQISIKKQLTARAILFLLSVGIGAGGMLVPDSDMLHSYLFMGLLHALYNPIARQLNLPLGMANTSRIFESTVRYFKPSKRKLTRVLPDGSIVLDENFRRHLGNVNQNNIQLKTFKNFPVVAMHVPHRAARESALRTINSSDECPLCTMLNATQEEAIDIGNNFFVVPEEFPYFGVTGTVIRNAHQEPELDPDLLSAMLQNLYELGPFGFRVGYNHKMTGRKVDHQSYKLFQREMPIEKAQTIPVIEHDGVRVRAVVKFPVPALVVESERFDRLLDELLRIEAHTRLLNVSFNLLLVQKEPKRIQVYVVLRNSSVSIPKIFPGKFFGMIEASGIVLLEHQADFERPTLRDDLKMAYAEISSKWGIMDIGYAYRAHAAIANIAASHRLPYEIDEGGSVFHVYKIPGIGEVLKYFKLHAGKPSARSFQWKDFFLQGIQLCMRNLSETFTPTQTVSINKHGKFSKSTPNDRYIYILQRQVQEPTIDEQLKDLLFQAVPNTEAVVKLFERFIQFHLQLIKAGVFDRDGAKMLVNVRGNKQITGFDTSHLRDIFLVNIFDPDGYAEEWEDFFNDILDDITRTHPAVGMALQQRFGIFNWRTEISRAGQKIPSAREDIAATPMADWTSEIINDSASKGPKALMPFNPFSWLYTYMGKHASTNSNWLPIITVIGGFFEDTIVRYAILTWLFPPVLSYLGLSLSPMETVVVYAALFATLMHPKIYFGNSPTSLWFWQISFKKQLTARTILFLLSVGIGAGGLLVPHSDRLHSYLFMGLLHALYNPLARGLGLPLGVIPHLNLAWVRELIALWRENTGLIDSSFLREPSTIAHYQQLRHEMIKAVQEAPSGKPVILFGAGELRDVPDELVSSDKFPKIILIDLQVEATREAVIKRGWEKDLESRRIEIIEMDLSMINPELMKKIATRIAESESTDSAMYKIIGLLRDPRTPHTELTIPAELQTGPFGLVISSTFIQDASALPVINLDRMIQKEHSLPPDNARRRNSVLSKHKDYGSIIQSLRQAIEFTHADLLRSFVAEDGVILFSSVFMANRPSPTLSTILEELNRIASSHAKSQGPLAINVIQNLMQRWTPFIDTWEVQPVPFLNAPDLQSGQPSHWVKGMEILSTQIWSWDYSNAVRFVQSLLLRPAKSPEKSEPHKNRRAEIEWNDDVINQIEEHNPGTRMRLERLFFTPFESLVQGVDYDERVGGVPHQNWPGRSLLIRLQNPVIIDGIEISPLKAKGATLSHGGGRTNFDPIQMSIDLKLIPPSESHKIYEPVISPNGSFSTKEKIASPLFGMAKNLSDREFRTATALRRGGFRAGIPVAKVIFLAEETTDGDNAGALVIALPRSLIVADDLTNNLIAKYTKEFNGFKNGTTPREKLSPVLEQLSKVLSWSGMELRRLNNNGFAHIQFNLSSAGKIKSGELFVKDTESVYLKEELTPPQYFGYLVVGLLNALDRAHKNSQHGVFKKIEVNWAGAILDGYFGTTGTPDFDGGDSLKEAIYMQDLEPRLYKKNHWLIQALRLAFPDLVRECVAYENRENGGAETVGDGSPAPGASIPILEDLFVRSTKHFLEESNARKFYRSKLAWIIEAPLAPGLGGWLGALAIQSLSPISIETAWLLGNIAAAFFFAWLHTMGTRTPPNWRVAAVSTIGLLLSQVFIPSDLLFASSLPLTSLISFFHLILNNTDFPRIDAGAKSSKQSGLESLLEQMRQAPTDSFDITHAFDGTGISAAIVHVNSQEEMDNFTSIATKLRRSHNEAVIAVVSDEFSPQVEELVDQNNRIVMVKRVDLHKRENGLYRYDDVLEQPAVKSLPTITGKILAISKSFVPFDASDDLANRIDVILGQAEEWVRVRGGLGALFKAARATDRAA